MSFSTYPIRSVTERTDKPLPRGRWPATLAAVKQVVDEGLDLRQATVIVGENGAGKSTVVEAIAAAYGLSPEGGSTGAQHSTRVSESVLSHHLQLIRNVGTSRRGYFLRAETLHGFFTYLEDNPGRVPDPVFHEMSHGESFLEIVKERFHGQGLWVLDEPESALSFQGCLGLVGLLKDILAQPGSQLVMSTHSPLLAALPGAQILEVGPWGLRDMAWEDLDVVNHWKSFMAAPERYLRHL